MRVRGEKLKPFSCSLPLHALAMDYAMMNPQLIRKIAKRHFFQEFQNSFQWATGIGLEPHQIFFQKKIPTNTVARAVQSFGQNRPLLAG